MEDNIDKLDTIAGECRKTNIHNKRFLYSEMPQENSGEELENSFSEIVGRKSNPDFERI